MRRAPFVVVPLLLLPLLSPGSVPNADAGDKPEAAGLIVVDNAGKEHPLKSWKFVSGTQPLSWLAPEPAKTDKPDPDDKKKKPVKAAEGPEAFAFCEGTAAPFRVHVLTLIPLDSLRAIDYDEKMKRIAGRVARSDKAADDETLAGVTGYIGINVLTLAAEQDLGELGVANVKFEGGVERGIRGLRFPGAKPFPKEHLMGRTANITANDKSVHAVVDLQPLYRFADGRSRLNPILHFQTTVKIDITKIEKLIQVGSDGATTTFDVALKGGKQFPLVLVERPTIDGVAAQLEGFVGRCGAGYKLIPVGALREAHFDAPPPPKKPAIDL